MLSILLAPDSLKGSLSAPQACAALERGARRVSHLQSTFTAIPLADGGEGLLEAVSTAIPGGTQSTLNVRGPLGSEVCASWHKLPDGTAVIEMAQASGLTLVEAAQRDALRASTFGTGQLIRAALDDGCRTMVIGIGGSATTDGGAGMLQALGAKLLNRDGNEIGFGGAALRELSAINVSSFDARLRDCEIEVLCDVQNPLCGENGAAKIYGPQKGASFKDIEILDSALSHLADVTQQSLGHDYRNVAGAGAAGGLGFGLMSFCEAKLVSGIDKVLLLADFDFRLENADLVLTAEGSIDAQTLSGKALCGIARRAREAKNGAGVPVIAFGGAVKLSGEELHNLGILAAIPIANAPMSLDECVAHGDELLADSCERALRLWLGRKNL